MTDPFEVLADEMAHAEKQVTGRAPPRILTMRDHKLIRWNALEDDEEAYVSMLDSELNEDGEQGDHLVSVQHLLAFAHENSVSFDKFVKFKRLN